MADPKARELEIHNNSNSPQIVLDVDNKPTLLQPGQSVKAHIPERVIPKYEARGMLAKKHAPARETIGGKPPAPKQ